MPSLILRPTPAGGNKQEQPWVIQGPWGKRVYPPGAPSEFYRTVCAELGVEYASRSGRYDVVSILLHCSWIEGRGWVAD